MVIRVDGNNYFVKRPHGSSAHVKLADGSTYKCKRNNAPGTHRLENDLEMQTRVQRFVTKLNAGQERAQCALFKKRRYHPPPRQPASLTGRAAHARLALLHSPESPPRELSRAFWKTLWRRNRAGGLVR